MKTVLALVLSLLVSTALANTLDDPSELMSDTAGKVLSKLNQNHDAYTQNPELLHEVVRGDMLPLLDVNYSARLILGREGRGASDGQLQAFGDAMSNLLVERYSTGLLQFRSEEQLQIIPLKGEINPRMTRVRTRVRLESGGFAPVDYVFHMTDGGWKAFDVIVEGISYVTTYRNQIMPEVQAVGLDAVIERLNNGELVLQD